MELLFGNNERMMQDVLNQINEFSCVFDSELVIKERFSEFRKAHPDCFERSLAVGHITASAFVFDMVRNKILLIHHKKLNKWLQPGGHCDGDSDTLAVAIKEVFEETGLKIEKADQKIFDLDIHVIPELKGIGEHEHFDIRYLFNADSSLPLLQNHETNQLKWINLNELSDYTSEESLHRMKNKLILV